ncbi:MAG TPA: isoprenylcysteine carboxylmethyltransferase family protein [Verrucomicrobiae bacterium]|nr:isoprenylcysteine carboxylmethyltransferase family protein [Verrucomicrobiae bacterium]
MTSGAGAMKCWWCAKVALSCLAWIVLGSEATEKLQGTLSEAAMAKADWVIFVSWLAFGAVWLVAALWRKKVEKREPAGQRILHILFLAAAAYILNENQAWFPALNRRILPERLWIVELGVALTAAGVALAIWARVYLGRNWSGNVTIRKDHTLIRTGPYRFIRHPIYTGILVALAGTSLTVGKYRALVSFGMFVGALVMKAKKEESFLAKEFGPAFEEHKKKTGFLLPKFS